jgi:protein-S-isoprenylcysteine O-methyltransferase Ste14
LKLPGFEWPILASLALWCLLSIYWKVAARSSAPAAVSEATQSRGLHVLLTSAAQILVLLPVHVLRQRYLPTSVFVSASGLALEGVGLLLAVWARRLLGRNWSGRITLKVGHELVRSGPYRLVRHPIYTGLLGMYAGAAIVSGELHALIGLALAVSAYLRKILLEETNMLKGFGADYRTYRGETWALFPGLF